MDSQKDDGHGRDHEGADAIRRPEHAGARVLAAPHAIEGREGKMILPEAGPSSQRAPGEDDPMLYCPVCSKRLTERRCKLYCVRCGYYMSCADYY